MSKYLPEENRVHTYTVNEVDGPQKTFNSKGGMREKYMIKFKEHGYEAEFCPLVGTFSSFGIEPGKRFTFRIVYRKPFGDEIEAFVIEQQQQETSSPDGPTTRVYNLHGHPAGIAIRAAVDMRAGIPKKAGEKVLVSDVLADADAIYDWLQKKAEGRD